VSGLFVFAVGILLLVMDLVSYMRVQPTPNTDRLMLSVYLLVASVQLLGMGMIGEYLGKLFMSQSGLPQYIIRFKKNV
jgi:undecaprenyl-phosphate 4-deoxy-4-formamido-L-arabinose transferase